MTRILALACFIGTAAMAVAAPAQVVAMEAIKDKVSVSLGQHVRFTFTPDGDRLQQPRRVEQAGDGMAKVEIGLPVTDATPFPVQGVATRPYLVVSNGYARPLSFRACVRLKGSKEFFPMDTEVKSVDPGCETVKCWESGSRVEEVVLYQFALAPQASK